MVRRILFAAIMAALAAGCVETRLDRAERLRTLSAQGDAAATEQLGELVMFNPPAGKIDYPAALALFDSAAAAGDAKAAGFRALILRSYPLPDGNRPEEAAAAFEAARPKLTALADDPAAAYILAMFSDSGDPRRQEKLEAAERRLYYPAVVALARGDADARRREHRLRRAAEQGFADAMFLLGDRENLTRAAKLGYPAALPTEQAAAAGVASARLALARDESRPVDERRKNFAFAFTSGEGKEDFARFLAAQNDRGHAVLLDPALAPELHYLLAALGELSVRERAFPSDFQRSAWLLATDAEALKKFFTENRDKQNTTLYWLDYALAAARANQGECALYGARRYAALGGDPAAAEFIAARARLMADGAGGGELPPNAELLALARAFFRGGKPQPFYDVVLDRVIVDENQLKSDAAPVEVPVEPMAVQP